MICGYIKCIGVLNIPVCLYIYIHTLYYSILYYIVIKIIYIYYMYQDSKLVTKLVYGHPWAIDRHSLGALVLFGWLPHFAEKPTILATLKKKDQCSH